MTKQPMTFYAVLAFLLCLAMFEHLGARHDFQVLEKKVTHLEKDLQEAHTKLIECKVKHVDKDEIRQRYASVTGIRNNNPGNIKGKGWYGQIGTDSAGHAIFRDATFGIRALARVLYKFEQEGIDTVQKIVNKYAEDGRENYVSFLCNRLGVQPNEKLKISDLMHDLVMGIIHFECGANPYPAEYFVLISWSASR